MQRPITTLFMLMSVDGKISTGESNNLDFDIDLPLIDGVKEGLHQYYEIEQTTDLWSFNSGRVQAKMGINHKSMPNKTPVSFVLVDNEHLNENGIKYFIALSKEFVLITNNPNHPAYKLKADNLHILFQEELNLEAALKHLKTNFNCERLTIQSGGTLNSLFLKAKLIDYIDIVVAPILVGGKRTPTIIDGESLLKRNQLNELSALKLIDCQILKDSYLRLRYEVIK